MIVALSIVIFATITSESDNSIKWKFGLRGRPLIIGCRPNRRVGGDLVVDFRDTVTILMD